MKRLITILSLALAFSNAYAFEIYALGTSNTNCKNAGQAYTNRLNTLLAENKINAQVLNGGVDGDRPAWMLNRLKSALSEHKEIKLVIFEPGPNERNKRFNLEPSEEILAYLQEIKMPTIYVSHTWIQDSDEAKAFAAKYDATYYGQWNKGVPTDSDHRQYDLGGGAGHMTAKGCELWAQNMLPTIKEVINNNKIR
jgi:lysophospholipase L1-like esterase